MKDMLEVLVMTVVVTFATLVLVLIPIHFVDKAGCEDYAEQLNLPPKHSFTTGCLIKTEQGWIKSKNYIINKEEK